MISSGNHEAALVEAAQQQWSAAVLTNDAELIANLMHDDWAIVTPVGVIGAEQFLGAIRAGALSHSRMEPAPEPDGSPRVSVHGAVAVLTQRLLSTESAGGHTRDNDEWMTSVFIREDDRWLVALMHVTPTAASD